MLAVSPKLTSLPADQIVRIYAGRMQIEQTFRDLKNTQWGLGLSHSHTYNLQRLSILLLLGALLTFALWLIGLAARNVSYNITYGSRAKAATTLSIMSLAMHWIDDNYRPPITSANLKHALTELQLMVRTYDI